jgi:hypothetical protein
MTPFFDRLANRKYPLLVALGCCLFSVPLGCFAYNGSLMRYHGDDYCYAAALAKYGFWKAQWVSFFHAMPYHGNRYSLTLFSNLNDLFGPYANAIFPALVILFWVVGCSLVLSSVSKLAQLGLYKIEGLWLAEGFVFLTFYQAPSLPQILYWRSGTLPYTAALVFSTFLWVLLLRKGLLKDSSYPVLGLVFVMAVIGAGFSETGASLQLGFLLIIVGFLLYTYFTRKKWNASLNRMVASALAGTLVAIFLLSVSPAIRYMLDEPFTIYRVTSSVKEAALASWAFVTQSFKGLPVPNGVTFLTFCLISFFATLRSPGEKIAYHNLFIKGPLCAMLSCLLLVAFCMFPTEFARTNYPDPRALITARFVQVAAVAVCGYLVGRGLATLAQTIPYRRLLKALFLVSFILVCFYPLLSTRLILSPTPRYSKWSKLWDIRHRDIQAAQWSGITEVHVIKLKNILPGIGDLSADPGFWYNRCAAQYYGVQAIIADQAGWDK